MKSHCTMGREAPAPKQTGSAWTEVNKAAELKSAVRLQQQTAAGGVPGQQHRHTPQAGGRSINLVCFNSDPVFPALGVQMTDF